MVYQLPPDIRMRVGERMAFREYQSERRYQFEDDLPRDAQRALDEAHEDLLAAREAVAERRAGDQGLPLDATIDLLHKKQVP